MRFSFILSTDVVRRIGEETGNKSKVICTFGINSDHRQEIMRQFDNVMIKSRQSLIDFLDNAEYQEMMPENSGFSTHCCEIRNVCEISKIDIAGMSGDKVKSISGRVIFNDRDQICFRLTIDKGLRKCFIRDVQLFDENKKSFVDEIVKAKKSTGFCCSTLTKGE